MYVRTFQELEDKTAAYAGGKGRMLARLYQSGYRVPEGFIILPHAFEGGRLKQAAHIQVQAGLNRLRAGNIQVSFAVRSSALSEDSENASFAGEFETVLDMVSDEEIHNAISTVYNSRKSKRVQSYSSAKGMDEEHDMAVVVQIMVKADISGVIFTADPITGSRTAIVGNYVYGIGETLVSGEATPYEFRLKRPKGSYEGPAEFKAFAARLYKTAVKLEKAMGTPQDIEWAIAGGEIYLLQSRPITTLKGNDPATGEWNDSFTGDYLWSSANLTEATPDIMTPLTWSLQKVLHTEAQPFRVPGGHPMVGNIGGHPYINLSVLVSLARVLGTDVRKTLKKWEEVFGFIPDGVEVPLIPFTIKQLLSTIPDNIKWELRADRLYKELPGFIASNPGWCGKMRQEIENSATEEELISLWVEKLQPYYLQSCRMLRTVMKKFQEPVFKLRPKLEKLIGPENTSTLMSNLRGSTSLDSLGPLIALTRLAEGMLSREEYLKQYGHRGPHELEVSIPGADEDPSWLEKQLEALRKSPVDIEELLSKQQEEYERALMRLKKSYPNRFKGIKTQLEKISAAAHMREALRSEFTRTNRTVRLYALRVGEMTGIRDGVFHLYIEEILELLSGKDDVLNCIEKRKETHRKYCSLPPYPTLISGRFDVFQWANGPDRRSDVFDSHSPDTPGASDVIKGFAGAAGVVEGFVRKLKDIEEGHLLQPGEILVTVTTNIGWTPLFPHAAAIVTDVGAPLSHAAIVARELGIPAIVGCGNATMLLNTGDRISVDGGNGIIRIIETVGGIDK